MAADGLVCVSERRSIIASEPNGGRTIHGQMGAVDPYTLPPDLPVPEDDGRADHLPGLAMPALVLQSSQGPVNLAELGADRAVLYIYPRSGKPGVPLLEGWDEFPGARGCTPHSCGF